MSALLLPGQQVSAQETGRVVKGIVKERDSKGKTFPLPTAMVIAPQSQQSVYTGTDGKFSLSLADSINTLIVTYIGYESDTVLLTTGNNNLEVVLDIPRSLEEVVIARRQKSTEIDRDLLFSCINLKRSPLLQRCIKIRIGTWNRDGVDMFCAILHKKNGGHLATVL